MAISEQAVDSLLCIFVQEETRPVLSPFVLDIAGRLAQYIIITKNPDFFEIVSEIFTSHKKQLLENPAIIGDFIEGMVKRVLKEIENLQKQEKEESEKLIISKIWNIFRLIGEDKDFIPKYQEQIEKIMEPLFILFSEGNQVLYEDDMLIYVTVVTKLAKKVSPNCWMTLKAYPQIFARSKGIVSSLFPPLNQIIMYGHETISKDAGSVQTLLELGIQGLNPTHSLATPPDSCQAALLLHLCLQYLGGISHESWEKIVFSCLEKFKSTDKGYLKTK